MRQTETRVLASPAPVDMTDQGNFARSTCFMLLVDSQKIQNVPSGHQKHCCAIFSFVLVIYIDKAVTNAY